MKKAFLFPLFFLLPGCAVFEAIVDALGRVAQQFDGQPEAYVARVARNDDIGFLYLIDRVSIAERREGRAEGVRFEGLRETHVRVSDISFPGRFTDLALRPDGTRLAAVVEENVVGDLETYMILTDTGRDLVIAARTMLSLQTDIARACGVSSSFSQALRREIEAFASPPVPADAELEVTLFAGGRFPDQLFFDGWSADGDPVFEVLFRPYAEVRVDGVLVRDVGGKTRWLEGLLTELGRVRFDADTGVLVDCNMVAAEPPATPLYDIRRRSGESTLLITPPDGGNYTLFEFTGTPLRVPGQFNLVVPPFD